MIINAENLIFVTTRLAFTLIEFLLINCPAIFSLNFVNIIDLLAQHSQEQHSQTGHPSMMD